MFGLLGQCGFLSLSFSNFLLRYAKIEDRGDVTWQLRKNTEVQEPFWPHKTSYPEDSFARHKNAHQVEVKQIPPKKNTHGSLGTSRSSGNQNFLFGPKKNVGSWKRLRTWKKTLIENLTTWPQGVFKKLACSQQKFWFLKPPNPSKCMSTVHTQTANNLKYSTPSTTSQQHRYQHQQQQEHQQEQTRRATTFPHRPSDTKSPLRSKRSRSSAKLNQRLPPWPNPWPGSRNHRVEGGPSMWVLPEFIQDSLSIHDSWPGVWHSSCFFFKKPQWSNPPLPQVHHGDV